MAKKRSSTTLADRAWRLLRLALLWARKGGALLRRLVLDFKRLRAASNRSDRLRFGEREFSFDDETPMASHFRVLHFSCLHRFDDDRGNAEVFYKDGYECSDDHIFTSSVTDYNIGEDNSEAGVEVKFCEAENEEEGIDFRAEEFISKFTSR